jgi:hypothetical protein
VSTALLYFAYGSNLHPIRLGERVPSARLVERARLPGYALRFHKRGGDGSAKCNAWWTGLESDVVLGAVYRLAAAERPVLDEFEGAGRGYDRHEIVVEGDSGRHTVFTYLAAPAALDDTLRPFDWYRGLVVAGARRLGFPPAYVVRMEIVATEADPDEARAAAHAQLLARLTP